MFQPSLKYENSFSFRVVFRLTEVEGQQSGAQVCTGTKFDANISLVSRTLSLPGIEQVRWEYFYVTHRILSSYLRIVL